MKKYIQHNLIIFALINIRFPLLSSENSWSCKPNIPHKNWFTTQCYSLAQKMVNKHTYEHNSSEHMQDMAILSILPAHISQAILYKQRKNMKHFLIKNEENAFEEVRQYWGFDQKEWSGIMSQIKKDHEFNLNEMRKDQNFNTYHDPAVAVFMPEIKNVCKKYSINPKSLNFGAQTSQSNWIAEAKNYPPTRGILWDIYNPGKIDFNKKYLLNHPLPAGFINYLTFHELTHIMQGHLTREGTILNHQKICSPSGVITGYENYEKYEKYKDSIADKNLSAAQEKTADTFLACSDPEVAKIGAHHTQNSIINNGNGTGIQFGYPDNFNDMLVINTNWETSQQIEKLQNTLKSTTKKTDQITHRF
jgi:hypothetical protein